MFLTSPGVLWLLPLAVLPIILHLIFRRRAKELPFSSLVLLKPLHARALPRARFRALLLAAVRCLLLALLIVAYAGPVLEPRRRAEAASAEGLDVVVLLDCSYSMGARERGKTRFELAREAGREVLLGLGPADRAAVVAFSDRLETPEAGWLAPAAAVEVLRKTRLGWRGTDYGPALAEARRLLDGSRRRRVALLLGDGARHGVRSAPPALEPDVLWLGLSWPEAPGNPYLVSAGPAKDSSAHAPRLALRAAGLKTSAAAGVEVWVDGKRWQELSLPGGGGSGLSAALPAAPEARSPRWSGRAALRPDALPVDDEYFFSFEHRRRPRVLVLYGAPASLKAPAGGYFLKEAFGAGGESLVGHEADFAEARGWREARLGDYGVVLLAGVKAAPPGLAAALEGFARAGGGLWIIPDARSETEDFSAWDALLPAKVGTLVAGEGAGLKAPEASADKVWRQFELEKVAVGRYFLLQPRRGSSTTFRSPSGYPLLVTAPLGQGRTALWASSLDTAWSNLALKPVFPAWLEAVLGSLTGTSAPLVEDRSVRVGEPLVLSWGPREAAPASLRLRGPEGRSATLTPRDRRVEYRATEAPGLYELSEAGGSRRWTFAVNLDRASGESELEPLASPPWRALKADSAAAEFRIAVYGREARGQALAAAALLLALEGLLALPRAAAALLLVLGLAAAPARAQLGDRLVWAQLRLGPDWDPYPGVSADILDYFSTVTSALTAPERRDLELSDPALFSSPVLFLVGRRAPPPLSEAELSRLRAYLSAGGFLWIEDASGAARSGFDRWVRETLSKALPEAALTSLPPDHVLYKTFFLLREPAGRVLVRGQLEGLEWGSRLAVIYSRNDVPGAWAKDALGRPLHPCVPGGEPQRLLARKTAVNILMYALTGNYKADAVHQPYLLQKMRIQPP